MQVGEQNGFWNTWNKFMCIQGRHKVSIEDRMKLADYSKDRFSSFCIYCKNDLVLRRDPFSPREFFIDED